jgi:hypothetical protein
VREEGDQMSDPTNFDNKIRREEESALHQELVNRLHQHGLHAFERASNEHLADLLSAIDEFEDAVRNAGGDLFVDAADSSEPERPEFVLPHVEERETVTDYMSRVRESSERLRRKRI